MTVTTKTIPATQFRNQCLRLIDEVNATGEGLIVTKHGRPVAAVMPVVEQPGKSLFGWSKEIRIDEDFAKPAIPTEDWHIVSDPDRVLTGIPKE